MKKVSYLLAIAALVLSGCQKHQNTGNTNPDGNDGIGYLSFNSMLMDAEVETKALASEAKNNYVVFLYNNEDNSLVKQITYGEVKAGGNKIALPGAEYTLVARSQEEAVAPAEFENPVYGITREIVVVPGETTDAGQLVCTLLQTKVTVDYEDKFLKDITGDCEATVTVNSNEILTYPLEYSADGCVYEQRAGYFAINNGVSTTMEVTFRGSVEGKQQKMSKAFTVKAREWHKLKFIKKVILDGSADFTIDLVDLVEDEEIYNDLGGNEEIIADDPNAPQGDGGITLESTCASDITQPITVPAMGNTFVLTMKATVPNGVKKFTVEIQSTNPAFTTSVGAINDGQTTLDLVNPSSGAQQVFTNILPFPYGDAVSGKTEIDFDLSAAQEPILAFAGIHTFVMHVTDNLGCKNDIQVQLVVGE